MPWLILTDLRVGTLATTIPRHAWVTVVPHQRRQQLGFSDEAFSIAAGLKPHPSELEIRPVEIRTGAAKTTSPGLTA